MFSGFNSLMNGVNNSKGAGADIPVFAGATIGVGIIATGTIETDTAAITTDTTMTTTMI
ncbi:hypothetical protein ABIA20_003567 [Sinorhizobium fredii]